MPPARSWPSSATTARASPRSSSASPGSIPPTRARSSSRASPCTSTDPKDAARLGIEIVYQDLALADNLDVVQNMFLGREELDSLRRLDEVDMERRASQDALRPVGHDDPLRPPDGRRPVRRPAAVGGRRQGGHVELQARHPRRADRGARRRADPPGAGPRQAPRRAGPRRRARDAQHARRLRGRGPHHGAAARPERRRVRHEGRRRRPRSSRRSRPARCRRCPGQCEEVVA